MKKRRFISYSYVLFPLMIVITLVLTFMAKNNFTGDYDNQIGVMSGEQRDKKDIEAYVYKELIEPFEALRVLDLQNAKSDCFDHKLIFNYNYKEEQKLPFYKDQMVSGRVVESDCDRDYYIYTFKVFYDEKKILVQETRSDEWQTPEEFIKDYKNRIGVK